MNNKKNEVKEVEQLTSLQKVKNSLLDELDVIEQAIEVSAKLQRYGISLDTNMLFPQSKQVKSIPTEAVVREKVKELESVKDTNSDLSLEGLIIDAFKINEDKAITSTVISQHIGKYKKEKLPTVGKNSVHYTLQRMLIHGLIKRIKYTGDKRYHYQLKSAGKKVVMKNIEVGFKRPNYGIGKTINEIFANKAIPKPIKAEAVQEMIKNDYKHLSLTALKHELYRHSLEKKINRMGTGIDALYYSK